MTAAEPETARIDGVSDADDAEMSLDGARLGDWAHILIGEMLGDGIRRPTRDELFSRVGRSTLVSERVGIHRQVAKQRLLGAVALYFRLFAPDESMRFFAAEVDVPGARLDLLFKDRDSRLVADEIKSGLVSGLSDWKLFEDQLERELAGGVAEFGRQFAGVRAVLLSAPRRSFLLRPDGAREPLQWETA